MSKTNNDIKLNADDLYLEEAITDRRVGSIRILKPVKSDGSPADDRKVLYIGQAQMLTPMGSIPLHFEIDADDLPAAIDKFPAAASEALERTVKELEEMRREQASSIVVPGAGGGVPGGGKIQLK